MWQQQFINLAFKSIKHPINQKTIIFELKALSTLRIDWPKKSKLKVLMICRGKVLLTKQTTNKVDTTN